MKGKLSEKGKEEFRNKYKGGGVNNLSLEELKEELERFKKVYGVRK